MSGKRSIQVTKNYRLFHSNVENRPLDMKKHRKLLESMKLYGFLKCFPLVVVRDKEGNLVLKDGQHRLMIAEMLNLPVYWIEETTDFDVALVNCTAKIWQLRDYAMKHANNGGKAYQDGMDFADRHGFSIGVAFALRAGTTSFNNCQAQFIDGSFRVKDQAWAEAVAGIYGPLVIMAPQLKGQRFIEACMCVCRVAEFDAGRLLVGAKRAPQLLA